jgi:hypothetical protein
MNYLQDMLSSDSNRSSARVINFIGAVTGTVLISYDTFLHGLRGDVFSVYLAYCGGVYVGGKYLDKKGNTNDSVN